MISSISDSVKSALFPTLMNFENPIPAWSDQSSNAVHSAPDCEARPILPLRAMLWLNDALMGVQVSMYPSTFGPSIRI